MNYIHQLQSDLAAHISAMESMRDSIHSFRAFLHSPKFIGQESDGSRKDWIATGDVLKILEAMESQSVASGEFARANWKPTCELETV